MTSKRARIGLTPGSVGKAIEEDKPASMTQLAHLLGYAGSVGSSLTGKLRALVPDLDARLAANKAAKDRAGDGKPAPKAARHKPAAKRAKAKPAKPAGAKAGRRPRDPRSPFRPTSSYDMCFRILASYPDGLPKGKLIALLAEATGKDLKHAGYDAQVLLSARPNEDGLSNNDGPRHRSCKPGFWIRRTNGHVQLVVD